MPACTTPSSPDSRHNDGQDSKRSIQNRQEIVKVVAGPPDTQDMSRFTRVVVAAILSTATISLTVTPAHAAPPAVYVVKEGDSLSRIAQKLGVKLPDLLNANGMTVDSLILPGQQLVVPQTDSSGSSGGTYTVKAGDS